jgi:hypothetical protein
MNNVVTHFFYNVVNILIVIAVLQSLYFVIKNRGANIINSILIVLLMCVALSAYYYVQYVAEEKSSFELALIGGVVFLVPLHLVLNNYLQNNYVQERLHPELGPFWSAPDNRVFVAGDQVRIKTLIPPEEVRGVVELRPPFLERQTNRIPVQVGDEDEPRQVLPHHLSFIGGDPYSKKYRKTVKNRTIHPGVKLLRQSKVFGPQYSLITGQSSEPGTGAINKILKFLGSPKLKPVPSSKVKSRQQLLTDIRTKRPTLTHVAF